MIFRFTLLVFFFIPFVCVYVYMVNVFHFFFLNIYSVNNLFLLLYELMFQGQGGGSRIRSSVWELVLGKD